MIQTVQTLTLRERKREREEEEEEEEGAGWKKINFSIYSSKKEHRVPRGKIKKKEEK